LWITGLTPEDRAYIRSLEAGSQGSPAGPGTRGPGNPAEPTARQRELLELLRPVLVEAESFRLPGILGSSLAPDVAQWSAAYGLHAGPTLARRSRSSVRILGLGRCGQSLATLLAAAGLGALHLHDTQAVRAPDPGGGPLHLGDIGAPRNVALARHLTRNWPHTRLASWSPSPDGHGLAADATVVLATDSLPEDVAIHLAATRIPHLQVLFTPSGARIGPLVIPGLTACQDCATALGPLGPAGVPAPPPAEVAAGTAAGALANGAPVNGAWDPAAAEVSLAAAAAGLAAMQVLMLLDGVNVPSCADGILHVELATGNVVREPVFPRAGCTCAIAAA
jgi:hypothetical protein